MKNNRIKPSLMHVVLSLLLLFSFMSSCRKNESPAGSTQNENGIRLAILYPSIGSIKALVGLRKQGFLAIKNLNVVGVYHKQEKTDYQKSKDFIKEEKIDWLEFLELNGDIHKDNLFQNNPLSDEFKKIFNDSDGIIFFGGADIPPYIYNDRSNLHTQITTPVRSFMEISFVFHLIGGFQDPGFLPFLESRPEFPVLGLCLGLQSLNVGTGGTLVQDIWSEIYGKTYVEEVIELGKDVWHTNPFSRLYPEKDLFPYIFHPIRLKAEGMLVSVMGMNPADTPHILSAHHQVPKNIGKGFRVTATSMDEKVIEAIEHEYYPNVLGLQFHPEFASIWDSEKTYKFTPDDVDKTTVIDFLRGKPSSIDFHKKIWEWFTNALKNSHKGI